MPRYFFRIEDSHAFRDEEGKELPDSRAARDEASCVAAAWLSDHPGDVWADGALTVTVQDHRGLTLFQVTVAGYEAPAVGNGGYGADEQLVG